MITRSSKCVCFLLAILLVLLTHAHAQTDAQDWNDLLKEISSTLDSAKKNIWN